MIAYGQDYPDPFAGDDLLGGLRNGAWLDKQDFPPLRYAVPGVIPEGSTLLVGAPKIGKSWLVLSCALAKAAGGIALNAIRVDAAPVLYLALEDGDRRMQARCRILLDGGPIPEAFEYLTRVESGRVIETIAAWLARHPGATPLVILDTLGKVMPPAMAGESAYQRDYRVASTLKQLADSEPGSSLLTNHHDRKAAAEDFIDSVSGTHGLAGAADTTIVLLRGRNETGGLIKVTGRDVPEGEYAVAFDKGSAWRLDGATLSDAARVGAARRAAVGLGDRAADIIAFMAERADKSATPNEIALVLGIDPRAAGVYLSRLTESGRIERVSRGHYCLYTPVESVESVETNKPIQQFNTFNTPIGGHTMTTTTTPTDIEDAAIKLLRTFEDVINTAHDDAIEYTFDEAPGDEPYEQTAQRAEQAADAAVYIAQTILGPIREAVTDLLHDAYSQNQLPTRIWAELHR
jgi:AAA domain/Transcriptional regulator, AbiEi antitoxin